MSPMERKQAFDTVAQEYAARRPGYPIEMFTALTALTGLSAGANVLEIGCGAGQATERLVEANYRIVGVELGANLAEHTRRRFAGYPELAVVNTPFEEFDTGDRFDMIFSASAFHWIDPERGYSLARRLLRPGGWLALCWNHRLDRELHTPLFDDIHAVYDEMFPPHDSAWTAIADRVRQIVESGCFERPFTVTIPHEIVYNTEEYLGLLGTYSDHILLEPHVREALFDRLRTVVEAHGGEVTVPYETRLYLARRLPGDSVET
jgi:SAM-dependent methyltransferase